MALIESTTYMDDVAINTLGHHGNPNKPIFVYHHGLYGSKNGAHAQNIAKVARQQGCGFIAFDNLGHGENPTVPLEQADMSGWVAVAKHIINEHALDQDIILVANSWGVGPLMSAMDELNRQPVGFLGIGAAPDVIQCELKGLLQNAFNNGALCPDTHRKFDKGGTIYVPVPTPNSDARPYNKIFFKDAEQHTILDSDIKFDCPAFLYRGENDDIVTEGHSEKLSAHFESAQVTRLCTIENDDHCLYKDTSLGEIAWAAQHLLQHNPKITA